MYYYASATTTNKAKKGNNNGNGHSKRSSSSSPSSSGNNNNSNKGVMRLSTDPQSVAARERRHRISDRFKILKGLVPGGTKMDTVSMLEQAIHYVKFLKAQIWLHQNMIIMNNNRDHTMSLAPPDHCGTTSNESSTLYHHNDYGSSSNNLAFDEPNQVPFELPHQYRSCFPSHETASFDQGNMRM